MIAGRDAARPGEAKNSWLTGTAAWNWYAITQFILGIKPTYDGLHISPCIPSEWKSYEITRRFRNATYHIHVNNPDGKEHGTVSLFIDGIPVEGNLVPNAV